MKVSPKGQFGEYENLKELKEKVITSWDIFELTQTLGSVFTFKPYFFIIFFLNIYFIYIYIYILYIYIYIYIFMW